MNEEPKKSYALKDSHIVYMALLEQGIPDRKAAELAGYKRNSVHELNKRVNRPDVTAGKYAKPALKALKSFLEGKNFGEIKELKDSTVMTAINTVLDRAQPIVRQNLNVNIDATPAFVDLSGYETVVEANV